MRVTLLRAEGLLMVCLTFLLLQVPFSVEHFLLLQQPVWSVQGGGLARKDRIYLICPSKMWNKIVLLVCRISFFQKKKIMMVFSAPSLKTFLTLNKLLWPFPSSSLLCCCCLILQYTLIHCFKNSLMPWGGRNVDACILIVQQGKSSTKKKEVWLRL